MERPILSLLVECQSCFYCSCQRSKPKVLSPPPGPADGGNYENAPANDVGDMHEECSGFESGVTETKRNLITGICICIYRYNVYILTRHVNI